MSSTVNIVYPRTQPAQPLPVAAVAKAYGFPTGVTGKGATVGLIELGGGYDLGQLSAFLGFTPNITAVPVGSGSNTPDNNGADGEVQSDIIMVAQSAPDAAIRVYFSDQSDQSFLAAIQQALAECSVVSLSWGGPESQWQVATMQAFESAIEAGRTAGVPFFVAAGDSGADDGTGVPTVDFPASAPSSIAVGGTRLILNSDGSRASESLWDDNPSSDATGGGTSAVFPARIVPDIAGNADPDTGYDVSIDGQAQVIGGTSLPTPLFAGLYALIYEANGGRAFDFLGVLTGNPSAYTDAALGRDTDLATVVGHFRVPNAGVLASLVAAPTQTPPTGPTSPTPPVAPVSPTPAPPSQAAAWAKVEADAMQLITDLEPLVKAQVVRQGNVSNLTAVPVGQPTSPGPVLTIILAGLNALLGLLENL
jgi:kumamolisin